MEKVATSLCLDLFSTLQCSVAYQVKFTKVCLLACKNRGDRRLVGQEEGQKWAWLLLNTIFSKKRMNNLSHFSTCGGHWGPRPVCCLHATQVKTRSDARISADGPLLVSLARLRRKRSQGLGPSMTWLCRRHGWTEWGRDALARLSFCVGDRRDLRAEYLSDHEPP